MILDFSKFDGTGRKPRPEQVTGLDFIKENLPKHRVTAIMGPPAVGKTGIARAIQIATGGWIINPSNLLIDQAIETYPKVNFLKGKTHYRCSSGLTCQEWVDGCGQKSCHDCPYIASRKRALEGAPTFFNPMSLYYLLAQSKNSAKVIIVDEAHLLAGMIMKLSSKRFARTDYGLPLECQNEVKLSSWMGKQIDKIHKLVALYQNIGEYDKVSKCLAEIESLSITKLGLDTSPELFAIWFDKQPYRGRFDTFLNVQPIKPPRAIVDALLPSERVVLLSGTLLRSDVEELYEGEEFAYLDLPSPIPIANRPILYRPVSYPMRYDTPPEKIVGTIERDLSDFPGRNTIVHTTYARAQAMLPHFKRPVLCNTAETKLDVLAEFKKYGGVFLASGCAEGIDLVGDLCRLNVSPHFIRPNLRDPVVQKRKALEGGDRWYAMQGLKIAIQQYGRSTRDVSDESVHIVHEPQAKREIEQRSDELPEYYKGAIKWNGRL